MICLLSVAGPLPGIAVPARSSPALCEVPQPKRGCCGVVRGDGRVPCRPSVGAGTRAPAPVPDTAAIGHHPHEEEGAPATDTHPHHWTASLFAVRGGAASRAAP